MSATAFAAAAPFVFASGFKTLFLNPRRAFALVVEMLNITLYATTLLPEEAGYRRADVAWPWLGPPEPDPASNVFGTENGWRNWFHLLAATEAGRLICPLQLRPPVGTGQTCGHWPL